MEPVSAGALALRLVTRLGWWMAMATVGELETSWDSVSEKSLELVLAGGLVMQWAAWSVGLKERATVGELGFVWEVQWGQMSVLMLALELEDLMDGLSATELVVGSVSKRAKGLGLQKA